MIKNEVQYLGVNNIQEPCDTIRLIICAYANVIADIYVQETRFAGTQSIMKTICVGCTLCPNFSGLLISFRNNVFNPFHNDKSYTSTLIPL